MFKTCLRFSDAMTFIQMVVSFLDDDAVQVGGHRRNYSLTPIRRPHGYVTVTFCGKSDGLAVGKI
jgi:hypothetical protein